MARKVPSGNPRNVTLALPKLYISWRRNRSSLSRDEQFEQPRQQTRRTATPTVTRTAITVPFAANQ